MQITVHVPDDMVEAVKDKLPPPSLGVLEAVALDAILGYLSRLDDNPHQGRVQCLKNPRARSGKPM